MTIQNKCMLSDKIQSVSPVPEYICGNCTCHLGKRLFESKEKEHVYEFLMGFDDLFGPQILSTKPMTFLDDTYHLLAEEEHQCNTIITRKVNINAFAYQYSTKFQEKSKRKEKL